MSPISSPTRTPAITTEESASHGICWAAIFAGAVAAAAVSLALAALGSGVGILSVSPFPGAGVSAGTFTMLSLVFIIVIQWVASGLGGYLAGRLRTKWVGMHTDEVFFRDTAQGFLAWSLGTLFVAGLLASAASGGMHAGAMIASGAAAGEHAAPAPRGMAVSDNALDTLLRPARPSANTPEPEVRAQTARIIMSGVKNGSLSDADRTYLAQTVAARSGVSQDEALKRVDATVADARDKANAARKAAATLALFMFLALVVGAFVASAAGALGGQHRDQY